MSGSRKDTNHLKTKYKIGQSMFYFSTQLLHDNIWLLAGESQKGNFSIMMNPLGGVTDYILWKVWSRAILWWYLAPSILISIKSFVSQLFLPQIFFLPPYLFSFTSWCFKVLMIYVTLLIQVLSIQVLSLKNAKKSDDFSEEVHRAYIVLMKGIDQTLTVQRPMLEQNFLNNKI